MRTNRHQYFLDLAIRCAHQGTCLRRNFGAIIVDEYNTIVSTGYTGAPRKQMDCTELNTCWRKDHNIPSGSNYERCRSVHAEMNALLQAGKNSRGCTLYLAGFDVETDESDPDLALFSLFENDCQQWHNQCYHADCKR